MGLLDALPKCNEWVGGRQIEAKFLLLFPRSIPLGKSRNDKAHWKQQRPPTSNPRGEKAIRSEGQKHALFMKCYLKQPA